MLYIFVKGVKSTKIEVLEPKSSTDLLADMNRLYTKQNYMAIVRIFEKQFMNKDPSTKVEINQAHLVLYANSLINLVSYLSFRCFVLF